MEDFEIPEDESHGDYRFESDDFSEFDLEDYYDLLDEDF